MEKGMISILMGIYNCEDTLAKAIESIQSQTYTNWQLILCDDGSKDKTYEIANEYSKNDSRIVLIKNEKNCGLNKTLNNCLKVATGEYIARMDGDDESLPTRFEKEIEFLNNNPEYHIVGTNSLFFDDHCIWGQHVYIENPTPSDVVVTSPLGHGTVLMYKYCIDKVNGYSEDKITMRVEDCDLWIRLTEEGFRIHVIQEFLYLFRNDQNGLNRRKYKYRVNSTIVRLRGCKNLHLGINSYIKACSPMIIGLIPAKVRAYISHKRQRRNV